MLLILVRFSKPVDSATTGLKCLPPHPISRYFSPEYYLHKLDFLLRNPSYLAHELIELHQQKCGPAVNRNRVADVVRSIVREQEPELRTDPFTKFWRGAYERLDLVFSWWHSRELVYTGLEPRGKDRPQKYFFITDQGLTVAERLRAEVPHAHWYYERISLLHEFYSEMTAYDVRRLQYGHEEYRFARLNEPIPNLTVSQIRSKFLEVFGENLEVNE